MPTLPCPDCKEFVSPQATVCPHCGRPLSRTQTSAPGSGASPRTTSLAQLNFSPPKLALVTETVRNLTLQDLDDLASYVRGVPVVNQTVKKLQAVDLKGLEDLFGDQRARVLQGLASSGPGGTVGQGDAPSGCTCTPCCSTAVVEIDPFDVDFLD